MLPTPQLECGDGDAPETDIQGRVTPEDHASGRAARGFWCNAERVGTFGGDALEGTVGGFKVERYVDADGRECAYYDSTLLLGTDLFDGGIGTNVLDMSDPTNPVKTASLITPAMLSPHESLLVNQERGLLVATLGNPAFNVGILDVYDLTEDCRHPKLLSSSPAGILGHESGFAPDGMTFYSASPSTRTLVPVDLSDPSLPVPLTTYQINSHGLSVSAETPRRTRTSPPPAATPWPAPRSSPNATRSGTPTATRASTPCAWTTASGPQWAPPPSSPPRRARRRPLRPRRRQRRRHPPAPHARQRSRPCRPPAVRHPWAWPSLPRCPALLRCGSPPEGAAHHEPETTMALAAKGAHIVMAARDQAKADAAEREIRSEVSERETGVARDIAEAARAL